MFENLKGKYFLKSKSINKKLMSEFIYFGIHKYKILSIFSLLQPQDTSIHIYKDFRPNRNKLAYIVLQGSADVLPKRICTLQLKSNWNWEDWKFQTYLLESEYSSMPI